MKEPLYVCVTYRYDFTRKRSICRYIKEYILSNCSKYPITFFDYFDEIKWDESAKMRSIEAEMSENKNISSISEGIGNQTTIYSASWKNDNFLKLTKNLEEIG